MSSTLPLLFVLSQAPASFDVVIEGGRIVDGTGAPWFEGDLGISGDRIAAIGDLGDARANRRIDARGLVVAPGFIDTEMVREAIDRDPLADRLWPTIPRVLRKRLPPRVAGEAIARGIERRQARIIRPRRWTVLSVLRGVLTPLIQARSERDPSVQSLLADVERRQ